jgi:hypothetical protein
MKEISYDFAVYLFKTETIEVFLLYDDGTEGVCKDIEDLKIHHHKYGGIFGIEC